MGTCSSKQFDRLYEQFMPRLYRAALYLTGSRKAAAAVAERAFLQAASGAEAKDARAFGTELTRLLLASAQTAAKRTAYSADEVASGEGRSIPMLAGQLGMLHFEERALVVLSGELNCSIGETARILRVPEWLVRQRLRRAVTKICSVTKLVLPMVASEAGRTA